LRVPLLPLLLVVGLVVVVVVVVELSGKDADPGVFTPGSDPFTKSTGAGRSAK
jgi:hypothetical protein